MKRYLDALLAKASNQMEVVQPRTSSLFEPVSAKAVQRDWLDSTASSASRVEEPTSPSTRILDNSGRQENLSFETRPDRLNSGAAFPPPPLGQIETESGIDVPSSPARPPSLHPSALSEPGAMEPREIRIRETQASKPALQAAVRSPSSPARSDLTSIPFRSPDQVAYDKHQSTASEKTRTLKIGETPADLSSPNTPPRAKSAFPTDLMIGTTKEPRTLRSPQLIVREEREEEPPKQIKITIGRVDVRAVFQSRSDARHPEKIRKSSHLSLEEYLARRTKREP